MTTNIWKNKISNYVRFPKERWAKIKDHQNILELYAAIILFLFLFLLIIVFRQLFYKLWINKKKKKGLQNKILFCPTLCKTTSYTCYILNKFHGNNTGDNYSNYNTIRDYDTTTLTLKLCHSCLRLWVYRKYRLRCVQHLFHVITIRITLHTSTCI